MSLHGPGKSRPPSATAWGLAVIIVLGGATSAAVAVQAVLSERDVAACLLSAATWKSLVESLGGAVSFRDQGLADVPLVGLVAWFAGGSLAVWGLVAALFLRRGGAACAAVRWAVRGWSWWWLAGLWELVRISTASVQAEWAETLFLLTTAAAPWVAVIVLGGWLQALWNLWSPAPAEDVRRNTARVTLIALMASYVLVAVVMNWQLYAGLLIPHGDSGMYEEHLWNLTHGKGFRSYLDQGLFLGEHLQVVHVLLVPLYLLWPSHLLLELAESLALGLSAWAVYRLVVIHTECRRAALLLAGACILSFPLHYLDIAIDLKTFRPISFGVPFLLFGLGQLEQAKWKSAAFWFLLTLTCKEEYAIVLAMIGLWMIAHGWMRSEQRLGESLVIGHSRSSWIRGGVLLAGGASLYLFATLTWIMPWFRDGAEIHYVSYYSRFGDSMSEVVLTMVTQPLLLWRELMTLSTPLYAMALLVPLAGLPLLSPSRLAVGLPLGILLCLNELTRQPVHHFHAPVMPVLFWAAAAGLGNLGRWRVPPVTSDAEMFVPLRPGDRRMIRAGRLAVALSLGACLFFSLSPLGWTFWDPGSFYHWRKLYIPGPRADAFARVDELIPTDARVASTDYVHTRLTHRERSYDYSNYLRKVSGYERRVPEDTQFIVIDTRHYNSEIRRAEDVPELQNEPEQWELLPDETDGYFLILRRRPPTDTKFSEHKSADDKPAEDQTASPSD